MKTRDEVEELKTNWERDAIWDIECTEGFEEYHDELLSYRKEKEIEWENEYNSKRLKKSQELGIEGNYQLLNYIELLAHRIENLENKLH